MRGLTGPKEERSERLRKLPKAPSPPSGLRRPLKAVVSVSTVSGLHLQCGEEQIELRFVFLSVGMTIMIIGSARSS